METNQHLSFRWTCAVHTASACMAVPVRRADMGARSHCVGTDSLTSCCDEQRPLRTHSGIGASVMNSMLTSSSIAGAPNAAAPTPRNHGRFVAHWPPARGCAYQLSPHQPAHMLWEPLQLKALRGTWLQIAGLLDACSRCKQSVHSFRPRATSSVGLLSASAIQMWTAIVQMRTSCAPARSRHRRSEPSSAEESPSKSSHRRVHVKRTTIAAIRQMRKTFMSTNATPKRTRLLKMPQSVPRPRVHRMGVIGRCTGARRAVRWRVIVCKVCRQADIRSACYDTPRALGEPARDRRFVSGSRQARWGHATPTLRQGTITLSTYCTLLCLLSLSEGSAREPLLDRAYSAQDGRPRQRLMPKALR
jgi:hypothetical protein